MGSFLGKNRKSRTSRGSSCSDGMVAGFDMTSERVVPTIQICQTTSSCPSLTVLQVHKVQDSVKKVLEG